MAEGQMDGWVHGWMDGRTDGLGARHELTMDGRNNFLSIA